MRQLTPEEIEALGLNKDTVDDSIAVASQNTGLNPDFIKSVIQHESGGNPNAVSPTGPQGLMQLSKAAAEDVGLDPNQRFDPDANIQAGAEYLKRIVEEFGPDLAYPAYHDGPTKVREAVKNNDLSGLSPEAVKGMAKFGPMQQTVEPKSNRLSPEEIAALGLNDEEPPKKPSPKVEPIADEITFSNILNGFAARGNEAMSAINPWSNNDDQIAAEKEWVRTHPGADLGQIVADMFITAPAGGLATAPMRAAGTGIIEGLTNSGDMLDRAKNAAMSTAFSGIGETVAAGIGKAGRLFKDELDDVLSKLVASADEHGVSLTAAQRTNNPVLKMIESSLKIIPSTATTMQEFGDKQSKQYTKALFDVGHESADSATPEVMAAMQNRISDMYDDVLSRNDVIVDKQLKDKLAEISDKYMRRIPTATKRVVKSYMDDLATPPQGALIDGKTYQDIRSSMQKSANTFKNTDSQAHDALVDMKAAVDDALARSISRRPLALNGGNVIDRSGDLATLKQANYDTRVMSTISEALDETTHDVKPKQLLGKLARKEKKNVVFGKGDQKLVDIARVGSKFVPPKMTDEGSAQRMLMTKILTGGSNTGIGTLAAANLLFSDDKAQAAKESGLGIALTILAPKLAAKSMLNPNGYMAKGAYDLSKDLLPGLSRQKFISDILRNLGNQSVQN